MGKKGINLLEMWPEYLAGIVLIVGFLLSIAANSTTIAIVTAIFIGALSARLIFLEKVREPLAPFYIIIIALAIGFISGSFFANRFLITFLIIGSFILSYYLHDKKIIQTFKSKAFLK